MGFDRKAYKRVWDKERKDHMRKLVQRWKRRKGCAVCGYKQHSAALVLDHIDPHTKCHGLKNTRQAYNPGWSISKLKDELSKIQVLCANCHQVRTYTEGHHLVRKDYS